MHRARGRASLATAVVVGAIAVVVPPLLVVNAFRVLANDWFVRFELGRDGFPPDRYGLAGPERLELALTGLRSIRPGSEGVALLERATLPDGSRAFDRREVRHMGDVRRLLGAAFRGQVAAVVLLAVLALARFRSPRWRAVVPRGLLIGSLGTLAVAALAVPVILLGFDGFFLRFHELFFSGDTWRFSSTDTLLRLYPELFWQHTAQLASAIAVAQAVVLALVARSWLRRVRPGSRSVS